MSDVPPPPEPVASWTLARYAEVRAVLRHFGDQPRARVLHSLRLEDERWRLVDAHFRGHINDELLAGKRGAVLRFDAAFRMTLAALESAAASLDTLAASRYAASDDAPDALAATTPAKVTPPAPNQHGQSAAANETEEIALANLLIPPLPFSGSSAAPPPATLHEPPRQRDPVNETADGREDPPWLYPWSANAPSAPPSSRAACPPAPTAGAAERRLTVYEYAALCAELAIFPGRSDEIHRRYGLADLRQRNAFEAQWQRWLHDDLDLLRCVNDLIERYRAWFLRPG
jgi:hypothetical protein